MHPLIKRLGLPARDAELADSYLRSVRHRGGSEKEAFEILNYYGDMFRGGVRDPEQAWSNFAEMAERRGWDTTGVYGWRDRVASVGGSADAIPPLEPLPP